MQKLKDIIKTKQLPLHKNLEEKCKKIKNNFQDLQQKRAEKEFKADTQWHLNNHWVELNQVDFKSDQNSLAGCSNPEQNILLKVDE